MNEELKQKLIALGMTEDGVSKLETEGGVKDEAGLVRLLAGMSFKDLREIVGCTVLAAKDVIATYAPKEPETPTSVTATPPAAAPGPMNITVRTGNPEDMTVQELLGLVANGERSTDVTQVLRRKIGGDRRLFVRVKGSDQIDIAGTMDLINQDFESNTEPAFWGEVPTETLNEILQLKKYADPLTGDVLAKGDPWLKLGSDDLMASFYYAKAKGVLTGTEDKYTLVNEAKADPPGERFERIQALWNRGISSSDPLVMQARAAILYRVTRGTNRREQTYRDRERTSVGIEGGRQTGTGFPNE